MEATPTALQNAVRKAIHHMESADTRYTQARQRRDTALLELREAQAEMKSATRNKYNAQDTAFSAMTDTVAASLCWEQCAKVHAHLFHLMWVIPQHTHCDYVIEDTASRALRGLAEKFVSRKMINVDHRAVSCGKALAFCRPDMPIPQRQNRNILSPQAVSAAGLCLVTRRGVLECHLTEILCFADPMFARTREIDGLSAHDADRAICRCALLPNKRWVGHANKLAIAVSPPLIYPYSTPYSLFHRTAASCSTPRCCGVQC